MFKVPKTALNLLSQKHMLDCIIRLPCYYFYVLFPTFQYMELILKVTNILTTLMTAGIIKS